jgi:uncharacterized membrane protein YfcA
MGRPGLPFLESFDAVLVEQPDDRRRTEGAVAMDLTVALTGAVIGVVVGMTSTGGGALLTPALVLILGVPARLAVGSDVLIAAVIKLVGSGFYVARGAVHWETVRRLAYGSIPGALVGLAILARIPVGDLDHVLRQAVGATLVLVGLVSNFHLTRAPRAIESMPGPGRTVATGFVIGVLVATTSIGSGSLLLAAFVLWFPFAPATMVGTDLVHALVLSSVAAVGHAAAGRVDPVLSANVLAGAIPGVVVGANLATMMPQRALRGCLAAVLTAIGLRLAGG